MKKILFIFIIVWICVIGIIIIWKNYIPIEKIGFLTRLPRFLQTPLCTKTVRYHTQGQNDIFEEGSELKLFLCLRDKKSFHEGDIVMWGEGKDISIGTIGDSTEMEGQFVYKIVIDKTGKNFFLIPSDDIRGISY